jgi:DNA-directed RNA polymerase specialized sigma24 family protein
VVATDAPDTRMSPTPPGPAGPRGAGARLKPDGEVDDEDLLGERPDGQIEAWLADPVFAEDVKNLDRLLGDADMLLQLQLTGYAPKVWNPIAEEFARYGLAVLRSWMYKRTIFGMVKHRTGIAPSPCPEEWLASQHVVDDLAGMTVVRALHYFKDKVLKGNKWDPAKGASLRTFFIGQCLYQFLNVYKVWLREEQEHRSLQQVVDDENLSYLAGGIGHVEQEVVTHVSAVDALGDLASDKARRAFAMKAIGYTQADIAEALGLPNVKAVENLLGYQVKLHAELRARQARRYASDRQRRTS